MNKVGLFIPSVNHFVETLIYCLIQSSAHKFILITCLDLDTYEHLHSEHPWCIKRLQAASNLKILPLDTNPILLDCLIFRCSNYSYEEFKILLLWRKNAKRIVILSRANLRFWKDCLKELYYSFPLYINANSVILEISSLDVSPYFWIQNKIYYIPFPHPQILWNEKLKSQIYAQIMNFNQKRLFKFNFIGNYNPPERKYILSKVKDALSKIPMMRIFHQYPTNDVYRGDTNSLYIEYGDSGVRGIEPTMFIESLSESDFCISPMGWGNNWTHRTIEALLRGAIPIIEDPDRYNIGLTDMENCILVKNKNWAEAIKRASNINSNDLSTMRLNIKKIVEYYLLPERASQRLIEMMRI